MRTRFSPTEVAEAIGALEAAGKAATHGEWLADATWWSGLRGAAAGAIDAAHRAHPERPGLALSELRGLLGTRVPFAGVLDAVVAALCSDGFSQLGVSIRRNTFRPSLPPHLQAAGVRLRAAITSKPLDVPSRKELAPDAVSQQALRFLLQTGEAVEVSAEIVLASEAYARAIAMVRGHLNQHGGATTSELRQALQSSRRIVIPLLEKMDKDGVTRRDGDKRLLRSPGR